jgi:apolipoprotein D and lipocalin family protein
LYNGEVSNYSGKAWAVDSTNSKLKVQFFWPFSGDYWIVALDTNYQWAVVSGPGRDYLWILVT